MTRSVSILIRAWRTVCCACAASGAAASRVLEKDLLESIGLIVSACSGQRRTISWAFMSGVRGSLPWLASVCAVLLTASVAARAGEPEILALEGDLEGVHDPAIIREGHTYYVF